MHAFLVENGTSSRQSNATERAARRPRSEQTETTPTTTNECGAQTLRAERNTTLSRNSARDNIRKVTAEAGGLRRGAGGASPRPLLPITPQTASQRATRSKKFPGVSSGPARQDRFPQDRTRARSVAAGQRTPPTSCGQPRAPRPNAQFGKFFGTGLSYPGQHRPERPQVPGRRRRRRLRRPQPASAVFRGERPTGQAGVSNSRYTESRSGGTRKCAARPRFFCYRRKESRAWSYDAAGAPCGPPGPGNNYFRGPSRRP